MNRKVLCTPVLLLAILATGCSNRSSDGAILAAGSTADVQVKAVAPPADVVGKWRIEVSDGKNKRTSVYHFGKEGHVVIETHVTSPELEASDSIERVVVAVEKARIAVIDLSRTGTDGVKNVIPTKQRRTRWYETELKGNELRMTELGEDGKPAKGATCLVLNRLK